MEMKTVVVMGEVTEMVLEMEMVIVMETAMVMVM